MCAIFGIIDYKKVLSKVQREQMLKVLANECMSRGTDATGISYLKNNSLTIYKRPKKANKMRFKLPVDSNVIMGHTRMTTQGNEKFNFNNHPFLGRAGKSKFALAHNGVIYNDTSLRKSEKLPKTHIETDSYIAVQLIEKENVLNFNSIKNMAEKVSGSFCFSILDENKNLYLVKGSNPLCIMHFAQGFYVYASTQDIVKKFMEKLKLSLLNRTEICLEEGDILHIDCRGNLNKTKFEFDSLDYYLSRRNVMYSHEFLNDNFYLEDIKSVASSFGYTSDDVDKLISQGFTLEEIEEFFYGYIY
ncbi:MAG: hypothetical protein R3Y09_01340 [Clostridia bacterium]